MTDIIDNPPPLSEAYWFAGLSYDELVQEIRQIEAAAFERGKAAMQGEIERLNNELIKLRGDYGELLVTTTNLRAKLRALGEQPAIGRVQAHGDYYARVELLLNPCEDGTLLYLAAGAKHESE